ncbi:unnamed protein product [Cylicocyclus nassatus]|uniref:Uncharacterized protein n=1 Tax=Cylicocyclus nassatus TaxID=53992 RepID=A0AA36GP64_CYLNA|nr:unnamed protein product [Cylicocyclus nassatus]
MCYDIGCMPHVNALRWCEIELSCVQHQFEWTLPEKIYSHQGLKTKKTHQSKVEVLNKSGRKEAYQKEERKLHRMTPWLLAVYCSCAKWNDCDTCILSVFSFADHQMDKVKGDRLKQVCNLVSTHVGDSKPLKVCDTVLREVVANKAIFRKMQEYKAKGLNMKWFCAEELSKPYCTSKVPQ